MYRFEGWNAGRVFKLELLRVIKLALPGRPYRGDEVKLAGLEWVLVRVVEDDVHPELVHQVDGGHLERLGCELLQAPDPVLCLVLQRCC